MTQGASPQARARTDGGDRLIAAEDPLAGLQLRSGGKIPGLLATPALLELVRKSRLSGLRIARAIRAQVESEHITAWVEVAPDRAGEGCTIVVSNWHSAPLRRDPAKDAERRTAIARQLAELSARLGSAQEVLAVEANGSNLAGLAARMQADLGSPWTDFVTVEGDHQHQPLHWQELDGASLRIQGSARRWRAHLLPLGTPDHPGRAGFELHLLPDQPDEPRAEPAIAAPPAFSTAIGREIAPVLRQPIARIIANAETIRTQLAGPLAEEYSAYAADIATAGEHLLALLDDLVALEVVEDEQFSPAPDHIDLADLARRAAGILGVRARERGITVQAPGTEETAPAIGEFRRVLQVLLNLLGNAIRYSPEGTQVTLSVESTGEGGDGRARIVVADQGQGLSDEQQSRLFDKFERLGRSDAGGSGLGLYISRRLARAMGGDLTVASAPGEGARFTLELPADPG